MVGETVDYLRRQLSSSSTPASPGGLAAGSSSQIGRRARRSDHDRTAADGGLAACASGRGSAGPVDERGRAGARGRGAPAAASTPAAPAGARKDRAAADPGAELPPEPKPDAVLVAPAKPAPPPPKVETEPRIDRLEEIEKERIEKQQLQRRKIEKEKIEKERAEREQRKEEAKERGARAARTSAPRQSAGSPGRAAEATQGAAGAPRVSASAWQAEVSARVNSNTRYPSSAQGATGAATVSFAIDRSGRLVSAGLARSSGSPALDAEAVATVRRSNPFPPPPAGVPGGHFSKTINFRH